MRWISIDRRIMYWQCHKKLFSFYSANLIRKINANIVENVEKNLRFRKIFLFLNQNKNISNWKCLDFSILKLSEWSKKNVNFLNNWMWFSKSSQTQWIKSISNAEKKFSLKNSCCFWCDDIEFNIETKKTKRFVNETNMISWCFWQNWIIAILNSRRNIERKYEKCYQFHHEWRKVKSIW